jgi:hypothetical protein
MVEVTKATTLNRKFLISVVTMMHAQINTVAVSVGQGAGS